MNDRPIYTADGGSKWMAVKTVYNNIIPSWIVSLSQFGSPGSSSGLMFGIYPFQSHSKLNSPSRRKQGSKMPNSSVHLELLQPNLWKH